MKNRKPCTEFEYKIILEILRQTDNQLKPKGFNLQIITFENRNELWNPDSPMDYIDPKSGYLDYIENAENLFRYVFKDSETKQSMFYLIQARFFKENSETPLALFTVRANESNLKVFPEPSDLGHKDSMELHFSITDSLKSNKNFLDDLSIFLKYVKRITEIPNLKENPS
jgi:hypothetical protein